VTLYSLRRRIGAVIAVAAVALWAGAAVALWPRTTCAEDVATRSQIIAVEESARSVGVLKLQSVVALSGGGVGGLSGLWVSPDAASFVAVADDGQLVKGRLQHDKDGRLSGVTHVSREPLLPPALARAGKEENDSEDIAATPDGGRLVSFERHHRILKFGPRFLDDGPPTPIPPPPELNIAPENGGIEALAAWENGALLALQEADNDDKAQTAPGWFAAAPPRKTDDWRVFTYRPAKGFRPSGATGLPNGDALVLERRATWLSGFSARLTLVRAADIAAAAATGGELSGQELARFAPPFPADNFEGVATVAAGRQDAAVGRQQNSLAAGRQDALQIYIVSDDNYSPLQRTLFVHLTLPPNEESR
jgi:hypothetical protein